MKKVIPILLFLLIGYIAVYLYPTGKIMADTRANLTATDARFVISDSLFHTGDLIFRDGRGVISSAFRRFSLNSPLYSHAGIIHRENGKIFVYHIIGGEPKPFGNMKKETLNNFIDPLQANAFAVYRFNIRPEIIDSFAIDYYSKNIEFDKKFDLKSDDKLYCTEMVYKILLKASGDKNLIPLSQISGLEYIACDNIYLSPHSKLIYSFHTK